MQLAREGYGTITLGDLTEGKTAVISETGFITRLYDEKVEVNTSTHRWELS